MVKLELVGIHDDGEHLVVQDASRQEYQIPINEALRAAVRRDRPQLEQLRASTLRPREIQALIRSGLSAEEVAQQAGTSVEQVRRYEGPVIAEREFAAERARTLRVARVADAPTLGDLVVDRLAARNIADVAWDAYRPEGALWHVTARYRGGEQDFQATWEVDLNAGSFLALDDEARWLSEIDLADSPYQHLSAVEDRFYDVEADGDIPGAAEPVDADVTDTILSELDAARGVRQPLEDDAHSEPMLWEDPPGAHPPLSRPQDAVDATVLQLPESANAPESAPAEEEHDASSRSNRRRGRRGRTSVPSWDEIVFGAKSD